MELEPRFDESRIRRAVQEIAGAIRHDLGDANPLLVGILKGSFVFLADLVRELGFPLEVDFVRARSYGAGTRSAGAVEITKDLETDLAGRHVVVVEDIADTGLTMQVVVDRILAGRPASIRRCALLAREGIALHLDYVGIHVGPGFVVGYGIDYAERYRELRDIRALPNSESRE